MKKLYAFILVLFCSIAFQKTYASHCAGGELLYQWVSDSTYRITFKLYRDCAGTSAEPGTVPVCCVDSFNVANQVIVTLNKLATLPDGSPNGTPVASGCGGYPSKCTSATSTLPGFQEWWYDGLVTLPARSANWVFSVSISARNTNTNLTGGTGNLFYVATTLNNIVAQGNSSPIFSVKPVPYVCINNVYTYNNGTLDPNGDSIAYEIMQPQSGSCGSHSNAINFAGAGIYNTTNNPIATGNTFVLDPSTAQMTFTPTQTGAYTLTLKAKEYRNRVLIGSVMRDIQVQILNCNSVQPNFKPDTLNVIGGTRTNGRFEVCAGTSLNFCFKVKSPNAGAVLVASDNHLVVAPGSGVTYTGQKTDSLTGCFSWTPGAVDTGLRNFAVTVKDSTCASPGIAVSQTFGLPVYVYSVTKISKDSTICAGQSVPLQATGGTVFSWSVLPGGAPLSTLSCTTCSNPTASPSVTTRYVVTTNLQSICNKATDTVTITVNQLPPLPTILTNSPVCVGDSLRLTAATAGATYIWSGPAGFHSSLRNPIIANAQTPNTGTYTLVIKNGNCSSPPSSVTVSVARTPGRPVISGTDTLCEGQTLLLRAATTGSFYKWTGPNGYTSTNATVSLTNATPTQAGIYILKTYNAVTLGCPSPADTFEVVVSPKIAVAFKVSRTTICEHDTILITNTGTNGASINYAWNFARGTALSGSGAGPYVVEYNDEGFQTIRLTVSNGGCTDSAAQTIKVITAPASDFFLPKDGCVNDTIRIMGGQDLSYDYDFTWNFGGGNVWSGTKVGPYYTTYNSPGEKVVTLSTRNDYCPSILTTKRINIHASPVARITSASSNNDVCAGSLITFVAFDVPDNTYQWQPARYFSMGGGAVATGKIGGTGYVTLTVSDTLGCRAQDSMLIETKACCQVTLPTAFTPNNDGKNDVFRMVTAGHPLNTTFRIFNRWGQEVFATGDAKSGWDGTSSGKPLDGGTYYYFLRYQCADEQYYDLKGEVILIR